MDQKEIRVIRKPLELRATAGDDGGSVFSGYVYKFAARSGDLGGFVETIAKGAAAKWLAAPSKNLFAILDHEKNICNVLGDLESKTLALAEDDVGLRFEIHAGPTTAARDAAVVVGRNPVGMSFAFVKGIDRWSILPDGTRLRELLEFADLDDISIVVDAAYKSSDVTVAKRGLQEAIDAERRAAEKELEYRGAVPFKATPTDDKGVWDADAAIARVRKWSGGDKIDYAKYQQAFAYKTGDGSGGPKLGDYHLPHHDLKDGKLVVVWRGVTAAMTAVCGGRGGVAWEKPADREAVYNHLKKHYQQFQADAPELRSLSTNTKTKEEIEAMAAEEKRPTTDYLRRTLDLIELEFRYGGPSIDQGTADGPDHGADGPDHGADVREAHRATERALDAKRSTGAPSRALELQAAAANRQAATSATATGRDAAAEFHQAAAKMHDAAASDAYALDFQTGMNYRSLSALENRANPHHDEDGHFHDGSPESILAASRGKLLKAEKRHADCAAAYRAKLAAHENPDNVDDDDDDDDDDEDVRCAKTAWTEARGAHQDAIAAADAAIADVTNLHEARMAEHRDLIADQKAKWASPEYSNPAVSTTEDPAAATAAAIADSHASDAPVE